MFVGSLEERKKLQNPDQTALIGMDKKDIEKYSILAAIRQIYLKDFHENSLEKECSKAVVKKLGDKRARDPNTGFFIPEDVLQAKMSLVRDLTVGTGPAGGYLVSSDLQSQSFIELLRNKTMVVKMGARVIPELTGDLLFPKQTGAGTAYWLNEGDAPTESQQTLGQIAMTPKTIGAFTDISRKLIIQTGGGAEMFVRNDLAKAIALAIDLAAINGEGANGIPLWILNVNGIGAVSMGSPNGGAPTWGKIADLETEVAADNADVGKLGYLTNQKVRGELKQTQKGTNLPFIWENGQAPGEGSLNGYRAGVSNQVPSNLVEGSGTNLSAIIYGNFDDLLIGEWGALFVQADPFSLSTSGGLRVVILKDIDIAVRHPESFAVAADVTTT